MKLFDMPKSIFERLRITQGPSFELKAFISAARGEPNYLDARNYERGGEFTTAHLEAGHKKLCGVWLPTFQRGEVWTESQKRKYIEALLLGYDCGSIVLTCEHCDNSYDRLLLDGQQRLTAIRDFALDKFTIFNDVTCSEMLSETLLLPEYLKNRAKSTKVILMCTNIRSIRIEQVRGKDKELRQFYNDFNFSGTPHSEEERA